jgi:hypothetical protein
LYQRRDVSGFLIGAQKDSHLAKASSYARGVVSVARAKANTKILISLVTKTHSQTLGNLCKLVES